MIHTAENVARKWGIGTSQQNEIVLRRYDQYGDALANNMSFLSRFMSLPFDVPSASFTRIEAQIKGDQGVHPTTEEKIVKLSPVLENGTVTFAGQTHPADGNAAMIVTTRETGARTVETSGFDQDRFIRTNIARNWQ